MALHWCATELRCLRRVRLLAALASAPRLQLVMGTYAHLSVALIVHSVLSSNFAFSDGGALHLKDAAKFVVTDTTFSGNKADNGAAVFSTASADLNASVYAIRCIFQDNSLSGSSTSRKGGAVLHGDSSAVTFCSLTSCSLDFADSLWRK